jgi:hypothetical protein
MVDLVGIDQVSFDCIETRRSWLGVDLSPSAALIPFKLLILRYAKLAQMAKTANLSYTLTFNPAMTRDSHSAAVSLGLSLSLPRRSERIRIVFSLVTVK